MKLKTLYISDLDGTLLNSQVLLSQETIHILNDLTKRGLNFTVATARTAASVISILEPLCLHIPIILMNGVAIYDMESKSYLQVNYLPTDATNRIITVLKDCNITGFVYEIRDNRLATYYENLDSMAMKEFHDERVIKYAKVFTKVDNLAKLPTKDLIYFSLMDKKEALDPVYEALKHHTDISLAYYKDIYSTDNVYYLEIFSVKATKYNGVKYLKEHFHYDYCIGFGDNLNDIPLFNACNESYSVSNGKDELKAIATDIIKSNNEDGVATFIKNHFRTI